MNIQLQSFSKYLLSSDRFVPGYSVIIDKGKNNVFETIIEALTDCNKHEPVKYSGS